MRDRRKPQHQGRPWPGKSSRKIEGGATGGYRSRRDGDADGPVLIFGIHAVNAALRNEGRAIDRLLLTENAANRLAEAVRLRAATPETVSPRDLDRRLGEDTVHQGALLETRALDEPDLADLVARAEGRPLLLLDQVTDPHNVGAILRSAAVFGAGGLVMTRRHSPPLDGTLAKSASGALELVPIALVTNLARAITELKELGTQVIGLDGDGAERLEDIDWPAGSALVLGAEGKGLRQLTRDSCDRVCRISTDGPLASLNVSNAAAVALHAGLMHRRGKAAM